MASPQLLTAKADDTYMRDTTYCISRGNHSNNIDLRLSPIALRKSNIENVIKMCCQWQFNFCVTVHETFCYLELIWKFVYMSEAPTLGLQGRFALYCSLSLANVSLFRLASYIIKDTAIQVHGHTPTNFLSLMCRVIRLLFLIIHNK